MLDGYLSQPQVATVLAVNEATLRSWRRDKKGPPWKLRGLRLVVYPQDELLEWCEENNVAYDLGAIEQDAVAEG